MLAVLILMKFLGSDGGMGGIEIITRLIQSPEEVPNGWYGLMILQAISHVSTYLIPPLLYWTYIERRSLPEFQTRAFTSAQFWGLSLLVVLAFMPLNGLIIEWNQGMVFPDFLRGLEAWMRDKEDQLAGMTEFLTEFDTPVQFVVAMVVIGIIPAIGEEVLFRGVLQRKLMEQWASPHLAIWVAAALFSAIHVQFYGFVPRMLLGALFGYLYYWSGNLWVAIFAHFVNNGFMVLMLYLHHQKMIDYNIEDNESVPWSAALISLIATAALLYGVWKQSKTKHIA